LGEVKLRFEGRGGFSLGMGERKRRRNGEREEGVYILEGPTQLRVLLLVFAL